VSNESGKILRVGPTSFLFKVGEEVCVYNIYMRKYPQLFVRWLAITIHDDFLQILIFIYFFIFLFKSVPYFWLRIQKFPLMATC
jgi:hypothetical protein